MTAIVIISQMHIPFLKNLKYLQPFLDAGFINKSIKLIDDETLLHLAGIKLKKWMAMI